MHSETATASRIGRRTKPPFRADHVGSLLRPPALLQARDDHAAGPHRRRRSCAPSRTRRSDEVVRKQEEVGLQSATDGEFRRASWHMDFIYQLDGITKEAGHIAVKFHNEEGDIEFTPAALHVDGRLGVSTTIFGDAFRFLQDTVTTSRPEADDPVAEHGPLPRRQGGHRPRRVPGRWTRSGPTSPPPTARRCAGSASSAARTSSSTTRASRT